jgi:hypothetical protein
MHLTPAVPPGFVSLPPPPIPTPSVNISPSVADHDTTAPHPRVSGTAAAPAAPTVPTVRNHGKKFQRAKARTLVASSVQIAQALAAPSSSTVNAPTPTTTPVAIEFVMPEGFVHAVIDPNTGKSQNYRQLIQGYDAAIWVNGCPNVMGRLLLGFDPKSNNGTDNIRLLDMTKYLRARLQPVSVLLLISARQRKKPPHPIRLWRRQSNLRWQCQYTNCGSIHNQDSPLQHHFNTDVLSQL